MADDTNKDVATTVTDDVLTQAATDAVVEQTDIDKTVIAEALDVPATEIVDAVDTDSSETSELDADGSPVDHTDRSNLGRKITAFHRRQDEFEERINRLLGVMEGQQQPAQIQELPKVDPDEPVTFAEMGQFLDQREKTATQKAEIYNANYMKTLGQLSSEISEQEWTAISGEMKNINYNPSNNPIRDAEINFGKAERAHLRKALAATKSTKENPLKGEKPRSALGGITNQTVVTKDPALPKLDAAGQSYLAYVGREDGQERATKLHQGMKE